MKNSDPYSHFFNDQLTLRDELALDRTVLANERTFLAYVRTSLGFLILGMTFLHFLEQRYYHVVGCAFMVVGALILLIGCRRFVRIRRDLKRTRFGTTETSDEVQKDVATREHET